MERTNQRGPTSSFKKKSVKYRVPLLRSRKERGGGKGGPFAIITPSPAVIKREGKKPVLEFGIASVFTRSIMRGCLCPYPSPPKKIPRSVGVATDDSMEFRLFPTPILGILPFLCRVRLFPREKVRKRERESVSLTDSILLRLDIGHVFFWEMCGRGMSANWKTRKKFFFSRPRLCKEKTLLFCPPPLPFLGKPSYKIPLCYYAK